VWFLFLYISNIYIIVHESVSEIATLILSMSLNFIKAWRNDKWYNKRVLIWRFPLVLIKINYGQIGDQTRLFHTSNPVFYTGQSVRWKPMFGYVRDRLKMWQFFSNEVSFIWLRPPTHPLQLKVWKTEFNFMPFFKCIFKIYWQISMCDFGFFPNVTA